jgi:hypothetical protein
MSIHTTDTEFRQLLTRIDRASPDQRAAYDAETAAQQAAWIKHRERIERIGVRGERVRNVLGSIVAKFSGWNKESREPRESRLDTHR